MEYSVLYWHWLVLGMVLIMFEIFLPSFTALWFGLGACLVGLLLLVFPELSVSWQVLIWALSSALATYFWFHYFKPRAIDRTMAGLSREAIVGEIGIVIAQPEGERRGKLRFSTPILGAEEWVILSEDTLVLGDRVSVVDVVGNALLVKKS